MLEIGSLIVKLRTKKGITQEVLAQTAGISQSYLSQIERGQKIPTIDSLQKISLALDIPFSILLFLLMDEDDIPNAKKDLFKRLSPLLKELMTEYL